MVSSCYNLSLLALPVSNFIAHSTNSLCPSPKMYFWISSPRCRLTSVSCANWSRILKLLISSCHLVIPFPYVTCCNKRTNPLETFIMQHSLRELLLAAPDFTSLKDLVGFFFTLKKALLFAHFGYGPKQRFDAETLQTPCCHWTLPVRLFCFVSSLLHDLCWLPFPFLRFQTGSWRGRSPLTPGGAPTNTSLVLLIHFVASLASFLPSQMR